MLQLQLVICLALHLLKIVAGAPAIIDIVTIGEPEV
jgi:hypothetical protein